MEISQLGILLLGAYSLCFGILLGIIYDVLRLVRVVLDTDGVSEKRLIDCRGVKLPIVKKKVYSESIDKTLKKILNVYVVVSDVLFASACGAMIVLIAYAYNSGIIRLVTVVGLLVGFLAYYFTVGKLVVEFSHLMGFVLRSAVVYLYEIIAMPIRCIAGIVKNKERRKYDKRAKKKRNAAQ